MIAAVKSVTSAELRRNWIERGKVRAIGAAMLSLNGPSSQG